MVVGDNQIRKKGASKSGKGSTKIFAKILIGGAGWEVLELKARGKAVHKKTARSKREDC